MWFQNLFLQSLKIPAFCVKPVVSLSIFGTFCSWTKNFFVQNVIYWWNLCFSCRYFTSFKKSIEKVTAYLTSGEGWETAVVGGPAHRAGRPRAWRLRSGIRITGRAVYEVKKDATNHQNEIQNCFNFPLQPSCDKKMRWTQKFEKQIRRCLIFRKAWGILKTKQIKKFLMQHTTSCKINQAKLVRFKRRRIVKKQREFSKPFSNGTLWKSRSHFKWDFMKVQKPFQMGLYESPEAISNGTLWKFRHEKRAR